MPIKPRMTEDDMKETGYSNDPVAPGTYTMEIFTMDIQRSKADTKTFLNIGLKHTGDQRGPTVWDLVSVEGVNAKGANVSLKKLFSLISSLGLPPESEIEAPGLADIKAGDRLKDAHFIVMGDAVFPKGKQVNVTLGIEDGKNVVQFNYQPAA